MALAKKENIENLEELTILKDVTTNLNSNHNALPIPDELNGECFAIVNSLLGNGMCDVDVLMPDQSKRNAICFIRGKFRGHNKSSNLVTKGAPIIVGLREWDDHFSNSKTNTKCDHIPIVNLQLISQIPISLYHARDFFSI